jgi:mannitol-specific phosphotransferase system IIBC component
LKVDELLISTPLSSFTVITFPCININIRENQSAIQKIQRNRQHRTKTNKTKQQKNTKDEKDKLHKNDEVRFVLDQHA